MLKLFYDRVIMGFMFLYSKTKRDLFELFNFFLEQNVTGEFTLKFFF